MRKINNSNVLLIIGLVGGLTLTLFVAKNQQNIRQFAAGKNQDSNSQDISFTNSHFPPPNITLPPPQNHAFEAPNDITPPRIISMKPASGTLVKNNTTLELSANITDDVGVIRVEFLINGGIICSTTSQPYTCSWAVPSTPNYIYTVVVRAFDATGNLASKSIIVKSF